MFVIKFMVPSPKDASKTDVYRWVFSEVLENLKRDRIIGKLRSLFAPTQKFYISWFDGSDYCSIVDDETLNDAARCLLRSCPSHNTIRLFVAFDKREASTIFGDIPRDDHDNEHDASDKETEPNDDDSVCVIPDDRKDKKDDTSDEESKSEDEAEKNDKKEEKEEEVKEKKEEKEKEKQPEQHDVGTNAQPQVYPMPPQNPMMIPGYPNPSGLVYPIPMYMPIPIPQMVPMKSQNIYGDINKNTSKKEKKLKC